MSASICFRLCLFLFVSESCLAAEPPLGSLRQWLAIPAASRPQIDEQPFATAPLSRTDAREAADLLWQDFVVTTRPTRMAEMSGKMVEAGGTRMRFEFQKFGPETAPAGGRSLFISMHGGGGAPKAVNDSQWRNQLKLAVAYAPKEGIYVAPRAPGDSWDLWHTAPIDPLFDRLIQNFVALHDVNPDRVYLMGYSAGGDGVYQLAPRMADRWAAAAMMAGHPNETEPAGLRNVPFAIQVGENDAAYQRNRVAAAWGAKLDALNAADPGGYTHFTELHAGKGHWMDMADRKAVPWMEAFVRNPYPERVVWRQDDVLHQRFYWIGIPPGTGKAGQEIEVRREGATFTITKSDVKTIILRLNDAMTDLDSPVKVAFGEKKLFEGKVNRSIATIARSIAERGDQRLVFSAEVTLALP